MMGIDQSIIFKLDLKQKRKKITISKKTALFRDFTSVVKCCKKYT